MAKIRAVDNARAALLVLLAVSLQAGAQTVPVEQWFEAEHFSDTSGVSFPLPSEQWGRNQVRDVGNGDWIRYDSINFMDGAFDSITIHYEVSTDFDGTSKRIQVRIDRADGPVVAEIALSFLNTFSHPGVAPLPSITGIHDLYLTATNTATPTQPACSIDKFRLSGYATVNPSDAKTYYVSTHGSDATNDGLSLEHPFRTIQRAAAVMRPGSICYIRQGIYRETVRPTFTGLAGAPITYTAYNGEDVFISGADTVTGWSQHAGNVFRARMPWTMGEYNNQVLVDGEMAWMARSPNVTESFTPNPWWDYFGVKDWSGWWSKIDPLVAPTRLKLNVSPYVTDSTVNIGVDFTNVTLPPALLNRPTNFFKGALVTAHNHWYAGLFTVLTSQQTGGDVSFYCRNGGAGIRDNTQSGGYISHLYALLDSPNEWFRGGDTLYLWTKGSDNPSTHLVEAKRRLLGFDLSAKSWTNLRDLHFIATAVSLDNSFNCLVEDCHFKYVSHYDYFAPIFEAGMAHWNTSLDQSDGHKGIWVSGAYNTIRNCSVVMSAGSGIVVDGHDNTVTNCIIHDIDYSATYDAGIFVMKRYSGAADETYGISLTHNTIYNCGRSNIYVRDASTDACTMGPNKYQYNDLGRCGWLCGETGSFYQYTGAGECSDLSYNWFHDVGGTTQGYVILDGGGHKFVMHHNVFWNGASINGDLYACVGIPEPQGNHWFFNNTIIDSNYIGHRDWDTNVVKMYLDQTGTYQTRYTTNPYFAPNGDTTWRDRYRNNLICNSDTVPWKFTDAVNRDYTLRTGSPAIGRGHAVPGYVAAGGDWGAYEHGAPRWRPGADWQETPWAYPPPLIPNLVAVPPRGSIDGTRILRVARTQLVVSGIGGVGTLRVLDARGRVVASQRSRKGGIIALPTSGMSRGMYMVQLITPTSTTTCKVVLR